MGSWGIWASVKAIKNKNIAYEKVQKTEGAEEDSGPKPYSVFWRNLFTLTIYFLSMTVGLVGTLSLVAENIHNPQVWKITVAFGTVIAFFAVSTLLVGVCGDASCWGAASASFFGVVPGFILILGAFYCDWILAALAGNLVGIPSGDAAPLYWVSAARIFGKAAILTSYNRPTLLRNAYRCS